MPDYEPSPWDWVADHVEKYEGSGGTDGLDFIGFTCVVLTTTGRKSGKSRKSPLIRVHDGNSYVVIASKGGEPAHPSWYLNLVADPDVTLQDATQVFDLRARTVEGDEREALWKIAVGVYPDFAEYQERCDREIPVVVLERM